jgi:molybdopterin-containing oxidoreductase family molybdopterin binding subunit
MEKPRLTLLAASRRRFLRDDLNQILMRHLSPVRIVMAASLEEIQQEIAQKPDVILLDAFTLQESEHAGMSKGLRQMAGEIPLIVLLPADTRDYRDAAVELGANGVAILDCLATDLLRIIRNLISTTHVVTEANGRFKQTARQASPAGESTYWRPGPGADLATRSTEAVERLFCNIAPLPTHESGRLSAEAAKPGQVFVRHLTASSGTPARTACVQTARTACNHDCGFHYCGLKVTVRDGQLTKIEPADFPDRRYRSICQKGISYVQIAGHPQRLGQPLKRVGERGAGMWESISWGQALDEISDRIKAIAKASGPESTMFLTSKGQAGVLNGYFGVYLRLASLLGASALSPGELGMDSGTASGLEDALGGEAGFLTNAFEDLPNSKLVLIWGSNPIHSWMTWWSFFLEAKKAGTQLITIDPRFSATAAKSDLWIPIRPGTDLYLALAMINLIIQNGWMDASYVLEHTVGPFLVREDNGLFLKAADVRAGKAGDGYLVWDQKAQRSMAPGESSFTALTGRHIVAGIACRPAFDLLSQSVQSYTPEFAAEKTGLSAAQVFGLAQAYATTKPARIFTAFGVERWRHASTFGRLIATLGALTGNLGALGGGAGVSGFFEFPLHIGEFAHPEGKQFKPVNPARLPEYIVEGRPYPIRAVMVAFCNWVNQFTDLNFMLAEVLPKLDLLVVADLFMTETAKWADYVLPAATFFEREDMVKGPGPYIQHQPAILAPPAACRSDFDIAAGLSQRFGLERYFSDPPSTYLAQELAAIDPKLGPEAFEKLREQGLLDRHLAREALIPHHDGRFNTPSGRVEFYVERLLPMGRALPGYEPPAEADLDVQTANAYPLVCVSVHSQYRVNSTFGQSAWLREMDPEPYALLNPATAWQRQIGEGDWVRIYNARGHVVLKARLTHAVPPRAVYLSSGWHSSAYLAGHIQSLTHRHMDSSNRLGASMLFSDVLVEVARVAGKGAGTP